MMPKNLWLEFPENIRMFIAVDVEELTENLVSKFSLSIKQKMYILDLLDDIFLKKTDVLSLANQLDNMPEAGKIDIRLLSLDVAYKILWPLQDFLGGVDKLILRLGGKVPREKTLKIKEENDKSNNFSDYAQGSVRELMNRYENFKELRLSAKKIINKDGRLVSATVDNWIEDYIHFLGADNHDSLKRARYLSKAPNPKSLSEKDRDSLMLFLISYDENVPYEFRLQDGILSIAEISEKPKEQIEENKDAFDVAKFLDNFKAKLKNFGAQLIPSDIIMSEAENETNKVRDILWNAIGLGDSEKAISCLKVLLHRKALDLMIKEDKRFKNILKRFIGIRYGQATANYIDDNLDKLILRRLFLEMLFTEKIKVDKENIFVAAFYLNNLVPGAGQIIYLDKKEGQFRWREVQLSGNKFSWVDKL